MIHSGAAYKSLLRAAVIAALVVSVVLSASTAYAQAGDDPVTTIGDLQHRLSVGTKIYVTERDGREMTGRFAELTPVAPVVTQDGTRWEIPLDVVRQIQAPDPVWTGALIGAGIGGAMSLLTLDPDRACPNRTRGCLNEVRGARIAFPIWGGLVGLGLDWLHKGRNTVYRASDGNTVRAAATIAPARRALAVSVMF